LPLMKLLRVDVTARRSPRAWADVRASSLLRRLTRRPSGALARSALRSAAAPPRAASRGKKEPVAFCRMRRGLYPVDSTAYLCKCAHKGVSDVELAASLVAQN